MTTAIEELVLLRKAAEAELSAIEIITGPMDRLHQQAVITAFKGGAAFGAARAGLIQKASQ
jgi:cyanophycinase-like exopeptidase